MPLTATHYITNLPIIIVELEAHVVAPIGCSGSMAD